MSIGICGTVALTLSIGSHHLSEDHKPSNISNYNEVNPGISAECEVTPNVDFEAGAFKNSVNRTSVHAGIILKSNWKNDWKIATNIGLVSGSSDRYPVLLFVRPFIQYKNARVGYIPKIDVDAGTGTDAVITFEYSYEFAR
jgi:hypothetical protein